MMKRAQSSSDSKKSSKDVVVRKNLFSVIERIEPSTNVKWWIVFSAFTLLSFYTRLYKISEPKHVCWDETHFGKMGSWYINRTFFFDVHPPLGKMLIGLSGKLTGYDGTFGFVKPGDKYGDTEYVGMRVFCAILGAALVPFSFNIVWDMTNSLSASSMAASLITMDVGILTLSRYILLDPILLFFISGAVMSMTKFDTCKHQPFKPYWWIWLLSTGLFLSCAISVKFVGLFVIILVGIKTIYDLWDILGDLSKPIIYVMTHFAARAVCLILIPGILYMSFFYIHLKTLNKSGTGDGFFSSAFQSQLEGNSLYQASMPRDVAFGAVLTLKNHRTGGGYLHSHYHLYPEGIGARQQQVTAYSHKDDNNRFVIHKYDRAFKESDPIELLRNGDLIRIEHFPTTRNLHSHKESAPVTKRHLQVTCYGEKGTGDANDVWKVEVVGGTEKEVVHTVTSKLLFIHYLTGCALHSHSKQLPKWGYEQMEVTCNPNVRDKNNLWNVEDNFFPRLPNVSFEVYAPSFLERFFESHAVMFQGNAGLKPKEGEVTSKPWQWPINYRGQFFSANEHRIYLLGNPFIWWGNLYFMGIFFLTIAYISIRWQRGVADPVQVQKKKELLCRAGAWLFLGWTIHYLPFYIMGRVLYFHHYFPALLFSSMLTAVVLDYIMESLPLIMPESISKSSYHWMMGIFYGTIIYSFYLFYPLSYGMDGPSSANNSSSMNGLKWLESWEF